MRTLVFGLVSSLVLSVSGAALADPVDTSSAAAAAPEPMAQSAVPQSEHTDAHVVGASTRVSATGGEKLICHHPVHEGTTLPQEVCLTQRGWDRVRLREQKKVSDWQTHGYQAGVH